MRVSYAPAFLRVFDKLDPPVKRGVKAVTGKVIDFYQTGSASAGLGIKHLRRDLWEARSGLKIRAVYSLSKSEIRFLVAGTHDDVKRFLKHA